MSPWHALMQKIAEQPLNISRTMLRGPRQYKKQGVETAAREGGETVIETGDFHVTTVATICPTKTKFTKVRQQEFFVLGSSRALSHAAGFGSLEEFAASPEEVALGKKYGDEAEDLMTALHESDRHGSGKLNPS